MAFYTGKSSSYVKDRFNLAPLDITAEHIKGEVLYYFRYNRSGVAMCCTELTDPSSNCIEDIVIRESRGEELLYHAIEVKISESDFKREFWHKKDKHKERGDGRFYNYFYFAITPEILGLVTEYLDTEMLPYGIITVGYNEDKNLECKLVRRPEPLKADPKRDTTMIDNAMVRRMSSELTAAHVDIYKLRSGLAEVKRQCIALAQSIKLS